MKNCYILGINYGSGHNSSATIICNDIVIAAIEEERLTRKKNDNSFPIQSIEFCLSKAKINVEDINYIGIGWDPKAEIFKKILFLFSSLKFKLFLTKIYFLFTHNFRVYLWKKKLKIKFYNSKIIFINHHLCHAASSYYCSTFDESHILTLDGRGDWSTGLIAFGKNGNLQIIKEFFWPNSIGMVYLAFTHYLGFDFHDEYKVMGLAPYGKPIYEKEISKIFELNSNNNLKIDLEFIRHPSFTQDLKFGEAKYFSKKIIDLFGSPRKCDEKIEQKHMNIAASLQLSLNKIGTKIVSSMLHNHENKNLCLAGGVALNGVMNSYIYENTDVKNFFIQPASSDVGISLGAAAILSNRYLKYKKINFENVYLGREFNNNEIENIIVSKKIKYFKLKETAKIAAKLLANGYILGWFQGRSEFGPRALGNRSIIADARPKENKYKVNAKIKFREEFRPFAPSVLEEKYFEWFESDHLTKYMIEIVKVVEEKKNIIQAVTHVDGSARPQSVNRNDNAKYYQLISEFEKITSCPVILNTSFNIKGEPIVDSPEDAINCFFKTELDFLVIGNFLIPNKFLIIGDDLEIKTIKKYRCK